MISEITHDHPPAGPAHSPAALAASGLVPDRPQQPPGTITVVCPMGLTAWGIEGLSLGDPLFARVTYRPEKKLSPS